MFAQVGRVASQPVHIYIEFKWIGSNLKMLRRPKIIMKSSIESMQEEQQSQNTATIHTEKSGPSCSKHR